MVMIHVILAIEQDRDVPMDLWAVLIPNRFNVCSIAFDAPRTHGGLIMFFCVILPFRSLIVPDTRVDETLWVSVCNQQVEMFVFLPSSVLLC